MATKSQEIVQGEGFLPYCLRHDSGLFSRFAKKMRGKNRTSVVFPRVRR